MVLHTVITLDVKIVDTCLKHTRCDDWFDRFFTSATFWFGYLFFKVMFHKASATGSMFAIHQHQGPHDDIITVYTETLLQYTFRVVKSKVVVISIVTDLFWFRNRWIGPDSNLRTTFTTTFWTHSVSSKIGRVSPSVSQSVSQSVTKVLTLPAIGFLSFFAWS